MFKEISDYNKKIELLKLAANDSLYLQDMQEIIEDFKYVDSEIIEDEENLNL